MSPFSGSSSYLPGAPLIGGGSIFRRMDGLADESKDSRNSIFSLEFSGGISTFPFPGPLPTTWWFLQKVGVDGE